MPAAAVLTRTLDPTERGLLLTFITPAPKGCGLHCPTCFIDQRGEMALAGLLSPAEYGDFIRRAARLGNIAAVTIQGIEPLAIESIPWTEAILGAGSEVGAETGIVTSGIDLGSRAEALRAWGCDVVTVSLDADNAERHDRLRGGSGVWSAAISGIERAVALGISVTVNSILFPRRAARLRGMPEILARLGVLRWSVSPLLMFSSDGRAEIAGGADNYASSIAVLEEAAERFGIELLADDELRLAGRSIGSRPRELSVPGRLLRMTPDGACSIGKDVAAHARCAVLRWTPGTDVGPIIRHCAA